MIGSASTVSTSRSGKTNPAEARASDRYPLLYRPPMTLTTCVRENSQISCNERKILEAAPPRPPPARPPPPGPHPPDTRQTPAPAPTRQTPTPRPARADYRQPGLEDLLPRREGGGFAQAPPHAHRLVADHEGVCEVLRKGIGDSLLVEFLCHGGLEFCDARIIAKCGRPHHRQVWTPASSPSVDARIIAKCGRPHHRQVWTPASSPSVDARIIAKCDRHVLLDSRNVDRHLNTGEGRRCQPSISQVVRMDAPRHRRSLPSKRSPLFKRGHAPSPRSGRAAVPISRCCRRKRASQILRLTARRGESARVR